jgi:hypothetical protein
VTKSDTALQQRQRSAVCRTPGSEVISCSSTAAEAGLAKKMASDSSSKSGTIIVVALNCA